MNWNLSLTCHSAPMIDTAKKDSIVSSSVSLLAAASAPSNTIPSQGGSIKSSTQIDLAAAAREMHRQQEEQALKLQIKKEDKEAVESNNPQQEQLEEGEEEEAPAAIVPAAVAAAQEDSPIQATKVIGDAKVTHPITVVTAYYPLEGRKSKHSREDYIKWMANFYPECKAPIVAFLPPEGMTEDIIKLRGDLPMTAKVCVYA